MELTKLRSDKNLRDEARWFEFRDGRVLVARAGNRQFNKEVLRLSRNIAKRARSTMSLDSLEKIDLHNKRAASMYILLDWENFTKDGKEVPYTPEAGYEAFVNWPELYDKVVEFSAEVAEEAEDEIAEQEGNSASSSSGASSSNPET